MPAPAMQPCPRIIIASCVAKLPVLRDSEQGISNLGTGVVYSERLLARLRPVLDDYRAALDVVNDFRDKPAGVVRLTVAPPVAYLGLVSNISRFLVAYPEISVEISADSSLTDIVAGRFDAGIRHAERLERDMIAVRVSDEIPVVTVAAPSYIARHGSPQTPHELARHA